jgi:hypothetical protein
MDSTKQAQRGDGGQSCGDDTKLPGTAPVEDRSFGDDTKLPGTASIEG